MADLSQPLPATASPRRIGVPLWLAPAVVALCTLLGSYLRFSTLGDAALSWPEAMRWLDNSGAFDLARDGAFNELVRLSVGLFGPSEWAIRFPAALAGALSIPITYWLGRMLTGRLPSALAALLLAGSVFHIGLSQSGGPATLVVLLTVVFAGALLAWGRSGMLLWPLVAMLAGAFAAATAFEGMLSVAALAGAVLVVRLRSLSALPVGIAPLLAVIVATAVLTVVLLTNAPGDWPAIASAPGLEQVLRTLQAWASGPHLLAVLVVGVFLALLGLRDQSSAVDPMPQRAAIVLLAIAALAPIAALLTLDTSAEALAPALPFALLLAATGLFSTGSSPRTPAVAAAVTVVLLAISLAVFAPRPSENWRLVAERVTAQLGPDDCLVVNRQRTARPLLRYLTNPPTCFKADQRLTKPDARDYAGRTTLLLLAHAPRPAAFVKAMGRTHQLKEARIGPVRILAFTPKPPRPPKGSGEAVPLSGPLLWLAAGKGN